MAVHVLVAGAKLLFAGSFQATGVLCGTIVWSPNLVWDVVSLLFISMWEISQGPRIPGPDRETAAGIARIQHASPKAQSLSRLSGH